MLDEILEKVGLKYEELTSVERETLTSWVESLQQGALSTEKVRDYITSMREAVEKELSESPANAFTWFLGWKRDFGLKARLRNYVLLEAFLSSPAKAKAQIESAIAGIVGKRVN